MIPEKKIETHLKTAKEAVVELFEELEKNVKTTSDLILFLENGHKTNLTVPGSSPYVIGPGVEYHDDKYRVEFYMQYLKAGGRERHEKLKEAGHIEDLESFQRFSLFLELMIYCHLWENRKNLRELKQIAMLLEGNSYDWDVKVPDYGKSKFIDNEVKSVFVNHKLKAGALIDSIYFSQIRNAFAHSQFSFMPNGKAITLGNYDGTKFKNIKQIKIEDWEDIILESILFFHQFLIMKESKRIEYGEQNPILKIDFPIAPGRKRQIEIYWHEPGKAYSFNKPEAS